jgi:hypothetical protein
VEAKVYQLTHGKRVFGSRHDFELALKHTKNLVFSTREKQRFDLMHPHLVLDLLVFTKEKGVDDECFLQHLRTGYFNEVYVKMERYHRLMDETGLSEIPRIPKICSTRGSWLEDSSSVSADSNVSGEDFERMMLEEQFPIKDNMLVIDVNSNSLGGQPNIKYVSKEKFKEIIDLRDLLIGKLYSILNDVKNSIPLQGYCEHCPDRKILIKG